jgi:hypothetical protein
MTTPASASPDGGGWRAFVVLGVLLLAVGLYTWEPLPVGVWHDDGVYVLLGRTLAEGQGLRYGGVVGEPPATKFPPLYPAVLAGVWWLAPGFPANLRVIAGLNLLLLALAGGLFGRWCHRALALPVPLAVAIAATAWSSLDLWRLGAIPLSEPLFLVALFLSLLWGHRAERPVAKPAAAVLFLVGFALVFHARTIGVAVGAAAVLSAALAGRWRRAAGLGAGVVAVMAPWTLWSNARTAEIPPPLQDILGSYGGWLGGRLAADPWAFLGTLPSRAWNLLDWCAAVLLPDAPPGLRWTAGTLLLVLAAFGVRELIRRSRFGGLTLLLMLGALWLWPFLDRRLMGPVVPWLVLVVFLGGLRSADWLARYRSADDATGWNPRLRRILPHLPRVAVGFWAVAFAAVSATGLLRGRHEAGYRIRARAMADAVEAVRRTTDESAVVGAPELWAGIHLYTARRVGPSAPFRPGGAGGPAWGSPEDQYRLWIAADLDHVLVEHGGRVHGEALDRVDALCPGGAVEVRASYDGGVLVRLNWDDPCRARLLGAGE